jgi:hypothetical protein
MFRAFAIGYKVGGTESLHDLLMRLAPHELILVRDSNCLYELVSSLDAMSELIRNMGGTTYGAILGARDRSRGTVGLVSTSALCVAASEAVGMLLSSVFQLPFGYYGQIGSFIIGLIPHLAWRIGKSSVTKVAELASFLLEMRSHATS